MPPPDKPISPHGPSRRDLFTTLIAGVAILSAAISLDRSQLARAQSKTSQKAAKYQDQLKNGDHCAICNYFRPPHSCQLVDGDISPNGWCSFFAKKA